MDWKLICWCIIGFVAFLSLCCIGLVKNDEPVSRETIARIENGGRHL